MYSDKCLMSALLKDSKKDQADLTTSIDSKDPLVQDLVQWD